MIKKFIIKTDGGARGNPGPAAIGVVITDTAGKIIRQWGLYIGETTNNQAEYRALLAALEAAHELGASDVECLLDSELVVKQLKREYKVKDKDLAQIFIKVWNLSQQFKVVSFAHIPREQNSAADALVNQALDEHVSANNHE